MRSIPLSLAALALAVATPGCMTPVTRAATGVSKSLADDCVKHCGVLEMRLAAVVVVAGQGGCVCEPRAATGTEAPRAGAAAAAGAGAYIVAQQTEAENQAQLQGQPPPIPAVPTFPTMGR